MSNKFEKLTASIIFLLLLNVSLPVNADDSGVVPLGTCLRNGGLLKEGETGNMVVRSLTIKNGHAVFGVYSNETCTANKPPFRE